MKNTKKRTLSKVAQAAKMVRSILKKEFPGIKFSVRSESFSMGDSVRVEWTDGPTRDQVQKHVDHFQYGHFNGMEDMYELTNRRDDIPQTKWMQYTRNISEAFREAARKPFAHWDDQYAVDRQVHTLTVKTPVPANTESFKFVSTGKSGLIEDAWKLECDSEKVAA